MGLLLEGDTLPQHGDSLIAPEREAGWVTSAGYSPALRQNIAMGYVRREVQTPGTHLEVRTQDGIIGATVTELPFFNRLHSINRNI
jgi:aminomethyltransferase